MLREVLVAIIKGAILQMPATPRLCSPDLNLLQKYRGLLVFYEVQCSESSRASLRKFLVFRCTCYHHVYYVAILFADVPLVTLELGINLNGSTIKEGVDVYFECNIKSNPWVYKVSWRHNVSVEKTFITLLPTCLRDSYF